MSRKDTKSSTGQKVALRKLTKSGAERPCTEEAARKQLRGAFARYTGSSGALYDPVFDKTVRRLRPDWFKTNEAPQADT